MPLVCSKVSASRASTRWTRAAVGDEDLLAVEEEPAVLLGRARADRAEVRARLRLGEIHRALQLAGREARQVALPSSSGRSAGCLRRRPPAARSPSSAPRRRARSSGGSRSRPTPGARSRRSAPSRRSSRARPRAACRSPWTWAGWTTSPLTSFAGSPSPRAPRARARRRSRRRSRAARQRGALGVTSAPSPCDGEIILPVDQARRDRARPIRAGRKPCDLANVGYDRRAPRRRL